MVLELSDWECAQPQWTPTVRVLRHHQQVIDANHNTTKGSIRLVCSGDLFESFGNESLWAEEELEEILRDFGLIVVGRQGHEPESIIHRRAVLGKYRDRIELLRDKVTNTLSSTIVRECIAKRLSVRYLVEDGVIEYIDRHRLYR